MTPESRVSQSGPDPLEEAAHWFARLADENAGAQTREAWRRWLEEDAANRRAWARVEAIDRQFRGLPPEPARHALDAAGRGRRHFVKGLAMLALAGPLLWAAREWPMSRWGADWATGTGEIKAVRLSDGTRLWLNTETAVDIAYNAGERRIRLLAGEIHVQTHPDPRPMQVETVRGGIRPLGTRFSVRLREESTEVSVTDGEVRLYSPAGHWEPRQLKAGGKRRFSVDRLYPEQELAPHETAWTRGLLVADNMPLGQFLDTLDRYHPGLIRYDRRAAELQLVGSFPLEDTDRILDVLEKNLPVRISRLTPWWVHVEGVTP